MKRLSASLFIILLTLAAIFGLSSCGKAEYNLTFVVDGELYATVKAVENEPVKVPDDPEKDGYTFGGWYLDNGIWQTPFATDAPVSGELQVYAKWLCVHTPTCWITDTAPTCKDEGSHHKECSKCEEVLDVAKIDKLTSHTPDKAVVESFLDSTCSAKGSYDLVVYCSVCDALISTEKVAVEKKPHTELPDPAVAPTCTKTGLTAGKHCAVCKEIFTLQTTVPANDHSYINHPAKDADCENVGWQAYTTCSECDYTTYIEIPALGHMVSVTSRVEETLTNFIAENDSDYPFSISGNIITSTNRGSSANNTSATYTIIAKRPFTLALEYMTSTEADYDFLSIKHNGIEMAKASGKATSYTSLEIEMKADDTVTISYSKDGGESSFSDCVFVKLVTSPTEVHVTEKTTLAPATDELVSSLLASADSVKCATCGKTLAENPREESDT